MIKIAILSPKNAKLVVDNPLFFAQIDDGSFANYALTIRGLTRHHMKTKSMSLFI